MRLIVIGRILGRQLCRLRLHRWCPVRNISGLDVREAGAAGVAFVVTRAYFTDACARPGCRAERPA